MLFLILSSVTLPFSTSVSLPTIVTVVSTLISHLLSHGQQVI